MRPRLAVLLSALVVLPSAAAEFGEERDGFPVNVDGQVVYPYVPADLAARHSALVAELLAEPLNKVNGYTLMPYYPLLTAEMQRLATEHPGLARLHTAGQSRLGLDLWLLEIADFDNPERIPLEEREVVYLDGGTHSNEYSGVYFTTEWAQFLLDEYESNETARWIVQNRHVFILPMVNPDGSNAMGRLNAITVNVNRNFPATWGTVASDQPPLNWGGPWPASEPETQAVIGVMQKVRPDFVQSTHCCGNLWLHPYGAEQLGHAPDYAMFTNVCRNVFPDLTVGVERVRCGETWSTIYPASGTTLDEGYAQTGASSWSYEMSGRGAVAPWGQPIVDTDVRVQETESWRGVMHGMLHAEKYGALPRVVAAGGDADALTVRVTNEGWGNVTVAHLRFGPHGVALPALAAGQSVDVVLPGPWQAGEVPVELEWKKRMHPDSNWGRTVATLPLVAGAEGLVAEVAEAPKAPSMGSLLPEPTETFDGQPPLRLEFAADVAQQEAPAFPFVPLAVGLAALAAALAVRRRA
jgi:hypothetical protein